LTDFDKFSISTKQKNVICVEVIFYLLYCVPYEINSALCLSCVFLKCLSYKDYIEISKAN